MSATTTTMSQDQEDPWDELNLDDPDLQKLLDETLSHDKSKLRTAEQHAGFDNNVADTWIYPTNLPERAYQFSITQNSLYRNTLVCLPTGLGKTFIAAVIMYNIYRWYPKGKVIFMAPTRPLVAQQIEACQKLMPFPDKDTVELTGKLQRARREELWHTKRVFFATPQSVQSDILGVATEDGADSNQQKSNFEFPYAQVKLIVVDEAHKAKGRYAYTEVAQAIWQRNRYFRVLALSATPGRTMEDVAQVVRNLFISHVEVRWDTSIDVMSYVHRRSMKTIVVALGEEIKSVRDELLTIIDPYARQLEEAEVLGNNRNGFSRNFLIFEQKRFCERLMQQSHPQQAAIKTNFSICISLYYALELLERHGMRVFVNNFEQDDEGRTKFILQMDRRLRDLLERCRTQLGPNPFDISAQAMTNGKIAQMPSDLDFGHPKFEEARSCVLKHFKEHPDSRAIVFCEYRESVMLIYRLLLQHVPLLKPRCFVGQGQGGGSLRCLTQKQQIKIMSDFRAGTSNILIATSIGEEGIDVGEVELIVCFDISTSNPTRFVQRIGRTGRKKNGNVVMLVTEGREQELLKDVLAHKDQINKKILSSSVVQAALYKHCPRLVPTEFSPQCVRTFVKPPDNEEINQVLKETVKLKKGKKPKGSQDLRKFFNRPATVTLDAEDMEIFDIGPLKVTQPPGLQTQQNTEKSFNKIKGFFDDLNISAITRTNTQLLTTQNSAEKSKETLKSSSTPNKPGKSNNLIYKSSELASPSHSHLSSLQVDPKRLKKLNNILKNAGALVNEASATQDLAKLLTSKQLSRPIQLLMLKTKPEFVRETFEQIKILRALDAAETNSSMSKEEQEIRQTYEHIEDLFEGHANVATFLEDIEYQSYKRKCILRADDDLLVEEHHNEESHFEECVEKIFEGLDNQGFCCDNFDYIQQELKKSQRYQEFVKKKASPAIAESMVYETMAVENEEEAEEDDILEVSYTEETESKYSSQWQEFAKRDLPNKSTPIHTIQGPLAKAFKRQQSKAKSSTLLKKLQQSPVDDDEVIFVSNNDTATVQKDASENSRKSHLSSENQLQPQDDSTPDFIEECAELLPQTVNCPTDVSVPLVKKKVLTDADILTEFDIDLTEFSEPFPEEVLLAAEFKAAQQQQRPSLKEVVNYNNILVQNSPLRHSPDLFSFEEHSKSPVKSVTKPSLAAKLAQKINQKSPSARTALPSTVVLLESPKYKTQVNSPTTIKSPNLSAMALKRMHSRGQLRKLPKSPLVKNCAERGPTNASVRADIDESLIMPQRKAFKRKIFDSDSEGETNQNLTVIERYSSDSDFEEIAASQQKLKHQTSFKNRVLEQRHKRRRVCSFIEEEAGVSGSDNSEDPEAEHTLGYYVHDSVIVSSGEDETEGASTSHMQAMYLQSLKSPHCRPGAFKIPAHRVYNDHSQIFSQAVVPVDDTEYLPDSFVVNENDSHIEQEVSLCPLERAEKILKERRRAKKRQFEPVAVVNNCRKAKRICRIASDSSEEDY